MKLELDKRIKSRKDIFDCFNSEKAEKYIGERGYFSSYLGSFSDLVNKQLKFGTLGKIHKDLDSPFYMQENICVYTFFIPESLLKPKEKKYRPYTIEEFEEQGFQRIVFRGKASGTEYHVSYLGYRKPLKGNCVVILGSLSYSLDDLFENYEYLDSDNIWKPFGVEE